MNVHIFGAAAGIGRWFIEQVFQGSNRVYAYDIDAQIESLFEVESGVHPVHLNLDHPDLTGLDFQPDDWVLLAIPEPALGHLCERLKPYLPASIQVAVMTSSQARPVALVKEFLTQARIFGLHPLFGPKIGSPAGQSVALCRSEEGLDIADTETLVQALKAAGLQVIYKTVLEHDRDMAYVQALTHFILLSFAHLLGHSNQRMLSLMEMRTPPFQFLSAFASRMLVLSPDTYAAIQVNQANQDVRERFLQAVEELHRVFSQGDLDLAVKQIESIKAHFSTGTLEESAHYSGMAVSALQAKEQLYRKRLEQKTLVVFQTKEISRWRVGVIDHISDFNLELTEFITRVEQGDKQLIPCPVSDSAIEAYRKKGINVKTQTRLKIRKEHLELKPASETGDWLKANLLPAERSVTFVNQVGLQPAFVARWLPEIFDYLWDCQLIDAHQDVSGEERMVLTLVYNPEVDINQLEHKIQSFLSGLMPLEQ